MASAGRRTRIAAWAVAGVLGVGTVAGIVSSQIGLASADGSTNTEQAAPGQGLGNGMHPWGRAGKGLRALAGRTIHGEAKVETAPNTYKTFVTQLGKIHAVNGQVLTVVSDDGFSRVYTVDANTRIVKNRALVKISDLKVNDTVRVIAVQNGNTFTAKAIRSGLRPMRAPATGSTTEGSTQNTNA